MGENGVDQPILRNNSSSVGHDESEQKEKIFDLERGRKFGDFYKGFMHRMLDGDHSIDISSITNQEDRILAEGMAEAASSGFKAQAIELERKQMDARSILSQVFRSPEQQKLLENTSRYALKEHAKGVYEIDLDRNLYEELYGRSSQATAVKIPEGISFVMIPRFSGEKNAAINEKRVAENLPHETHHVAWRFIEKSGLLPNTEADPEMAEAFSMYRDEIIAKMVTGNNPFGYDHLQNDPKRRRQIQTENPALFAMINKAVIGANDLMEEIRDLIRRSPVRNEDLIYSAVQSSNFQELRSNFELARDYIKKNAEPEKVTRGWEST